MPLVDHGELHQQDERGNHVVEVIFAVAKISEGRSSQQRVTTVYPPRVIGVIKLHLSLEQLHPDHGEDIIHHLSTTREH